MLENVFAENSILFMVIYGTVTGQVVLFILLLLSSISWAIIFLKFQQFNRCKAENKTFLNFFHTQKKLEKVFQFSKSVSLSPISQLFVTSFHELSLIQKKLNLNKEEKILLSASEQLDLMLSRLERAMERTLIQQSALLEERLSFLATISSASPFIGLFGTVLGIIDSFQSIGTAGVTSLAVVAPGISEALIATAAGLLAAIPALMGYNYFKNQIREMNNQMRNFSLQLLNRLELKTI